MPTKKYPMVFSNAIVIRPDQKPIVVKPRIPTIDITRPNNKKGIKFK